jgi:hypothetical protein
MADRSDAAAEEIRLCTALKKTCVVLPKTSTRNAPAKFILSGWLYPENRLTAGICQPALLRSMAPTSMMMKAPELDAIASISLSVAPFVTFNLNQTQAH